MNDNEPSQAELREHAGALRLHGLLAHWGEVMGQPEQARWVAQMLSWDKFGADCLFQIISHRYERGATLLTTNRDG